MSHSRMHLRWSLRTVAMVSRTYSGQPQCATLQVDPTSPYEVILVDSWKWAFLGNHGHCFPDVVYFLVMESLGNGMNLNASLI